LLSIEPGPNTSWVLAAALIGVLCLALSLFSLVRERYRSASICMVAAGASFGVWTALLPRGRGDNPNRIDRQSLKSNDQDGLATIRDLVDQLGAIGGLWLEPGVAP